MADPISGSLIAAELLPAATSIPALASTTALAAPFAAEATAASLPGIVSQAAPFMASSNPFVSALGQGQIVGGMSGPASSIGGNTLLGSETLGGAWKDITAANDWMNKNQMATQLGMKAASSLMQQPQVHFAQPGQIHRGQVQPMDYMSLLNPQQSTVIRPQPISLI
jgi:hypothetical protein